MWRYELTKPEGLDALELKEAPIPEPGIGQALMRTASIGVNRAELMATRGHYPMTIPGTPGLEGGGEIVKVGSSLGRWKEGDLVSPAHGAFVEKGRGSYAEYVLIDEEDLVAAPKNIDRRHIGGLWLPYVTAYHGLIHLGELAKGQIVVIPAATSSVGLAAIQIAQDLGAQPIGYTTSAAKLEALMEASGLDEAHIICAERESLTEGLKRTLGTERPGLFFDPIGGAFLEEEIKALRPAGAIVLYGNLGGKGEILAGRLVTKRARVLGCNLGGVRVDPSVMRATYRTLVEKLESGAYKPIAAREFPFNQAREALEFMAKNSHIGKIYLAENA
jgi:NADPH:quinone reductase-like Zn-dependent oxidoreductase